MKKNDSYWLLHISEKNCAVLYCNVQCSTAQYSQHNAKTIGQYNMRVRNKKECQVKPQHNIRQYSITDHLFCSPGIAIAFAEWILIINSCTESEVITAVKSGIKAPSVRVRVSGAIEVQGPFSDSSHSAPDKRVKRSKRSRKKK